MRLTVLSAGLSLVAGLLVSAGGATSATAADRGAEPRRTFSAPALRAVPQRDAPVDARVGNLTNRPAKLGSGARRLTSASVRQDLLRDRVSGRFVLDAEPTGIGTEATLLVGFGDIEGTTCYGDVQKSTITWGTMSAGFTRTGRVITMDIAEGQAGYESWDCAFAVLDLDLQDPDPNTERSILLGTLSNVYATPRLSIGKPEQLGRAVKRLSLVRGVWTTVSVPVVNDTRVNAERVRVTGSGRGLKVRATSIGRVYETSKGTARVQVKRVGRRAGQLRLVAKGVNSPAARRSVATRSVRPPTGPRPGRYTTSDGRIDFRITGGARRKVTGFRNYTMTTCGGYPDVFTYTMNYYDFPTTVIPRNGVVDRRQKARLYTVFLRLRAVGSKVTSARFAYYGPNRCFAVDSFTARRVGR